MTYDDMLDTTPPKRKGGRPKGGKNKPRDPEKISTRAAHLKTTMEGVTIQWLQKTFRTTRGKIEIDLVGCPVLRTDPNGNPRYDIAVAAEYLVKPKRGFDDMLRDIKAGDLPETLRETFWNAKMKEIKYRVLAGDLWLTEQVMEVLGDTFQTIKKVAMLWTDTIEENLGMTDEQRKLQIELVDRLMLDIQEALVDNVQGGTTESFVKELDG